MILKTLFESVNEGLFIVEVTQAGDYRFQACNPAFAAWLGSSPAAVKNQDPETCLHPGFATPFYHHCQQCLDSRASVRYQHTIGHRSLIITLSPVLEQDPQEWLPIRQIVGACQDVSDLKQAEAALESSRSRLQLQNQTLLQLAYQQALAIGDLSLALRHITEAAAEMLQVERVGVWLYSQDRTELMCVDLYDRLHQAHSQDHSLKICDYPAYFGALEMERAIAASDVNADPRTFELGQTYIPTSQIGALLDAPIRSGGQVVGVICHEHRGGSRFWAEEDITFAGSVADLVTLALEAAERRQAELALRRAEDRYRLFFEEAVEGIFFTTASGQCISANPMLARILGYDSPTDLIDHLTDVSTHLYVDPQRRKQFLQQIEAHGAVWNFESAVLRKDGSITWISENTRAVREPDGTLMGYEGTVEDITARRRDQAIIEYMAFYDSLTGLANRERFDQQLEETLQEAETLDLMVGVLFIDLDRFKQFNDTLGHQVGDELLKLAADRLKSCVRGGDVVARWGGDEFTILLPRIHSSDEAVRVAQRIQASFSQPILVGSQSLHITCSSGIALYPRDGHNGSTLLQCADLALYQVKEAGRNGYSLFHPSMNAEALDRMRLETDLREAVNLGQLRLYYQPLIDRVTGSLVSVEALLRWQHPEMGLVSPGVFIPIAEESGLIVSIGQWVLEAACRQCRVWHEAGIPSLKMSVNLSVRQFRQPDLVEMVQRILASTGLDPHFLKLEITETVAMNHLETVLQVLHQLRALGIQIALDDFGVGYSSLNYLKRFPINALKIDQSFVAGIPGDPSDVAVLRAIINLGRGLKMQVVAEGVETEAQVAFLQELGVDEMQGYYFSRPLPPDQALDFMLHHTPCPHRIPD